MTESTLLVLTDMRVLWGIAWSQFAGGKKLGAHAAQGKRSYEISGKLHVTHAATGEPIASFRVTPGFSLYGDPDCDPPQAIDVINGAYTAYFNKMARDPLQH